MSDLLKANRDKAAKEGGDKIILPKPHVYRRHGEAIPKPVLLRNMSGLNKSETGSLLGEMLFGRRD